MRHDDRWPDTRMRTHFAESAEVMLRVSERCDRAILEAPHAIAATFRSGGTVMLCGNGGSAADCQHVAAEFVSRLTSDFQRPGLPAIALTTDSSFLTANDCGYDGVFARQVQALGDMVREGISILSGRHDITEFGKLLHEAWQTKRSLSSQVSNSHIEEIYDTALSAGAIGGKVIGAGGGGFMLFFVHPSEQPRVREALYRLIHVPFKFEYSGSQIIYFDSEEDHSAAERDRAQRSIAEFMEFQEFLPAGDEQRATVGASS